MRFLHIEAVDFKCARWCRALHQKNANKTVLHNVANAPWQTSTIGRGFPEPARWTPALCPSTFAHGRPVPSSALSSPHPTTDLPPIPRSAPPQPHASPPHASPPLLGLRPPGNCQTNGRLSSRRAQPDTRSVALDFPGSIPYSATVTALPVSGRAAFTFCEKQECEVNLPVT